jgi:hypothetical protein
MSRVDWILAQPLFWILVVVIIITGMVGIRRAGAVLTAHQAGLVGGRAALGPGQGYAQAGSDLSTWWGIAPGNAGSVVEIVEDPARRSIIVRLRGAMATLFGQGADLGAASFQRWEDFYPGPPGEFE